MKEKLEVFPNLWNTLGVGAVAAASGVLVCLAVLLGATTLPIAYFVGGMALAASGIGLLAIARRPWIVVDEDGLWYLPYGRFALEEIESVTPFAWMGHRGVKIRLTKDQIRRRRQSIFGQVLIATMRPFLGPCLFVSCAGCSASWQQLYKAIRRRRGA